MRTRSSTAYSVASIKERSPEVHLFIEMPPDAVDVNVHPTKAEVRFREQSLVHEVVRRALMDALGQGRRAAAAAAAGSPSAPRPIDAGDSGRAGRRHRFRAGGCQRIRLRSGLSRTDASAGPRMQSAATSVRLSRTHRSRPDVDPDIRPMIPLGQFRDTFIIAVDDEGIAIIDQHVAHERVLFERVMERLTAGPLESQRLLVPLVIEFCLRAPTRRWSAARRELATARLRARELRRRHAQSRRPCRRCSSAEDSAQALRALGGGPRRPRPRRRRAGSAAADRGDHRLPCRGEGELSADVREDGAHPRRAAGDRLFDGLSARPAGHAAADAAGNRKELRADLMNAWRRLIYYLGRAAQLIGYVAAARRCLHRRAARPRREAVRRRRRGVSGRVGPHKDCKTSNLSLTSPAPLLQF